MTRGRDGDPLRILLVEDNPGDVHLIREAFAESTVDSSLTTVSDGEAALGYLKGHHGPETRPDLVLLDLNVPKVDGKTVLEAIEPDPEQSAVPVAIFTSSESRDDVHETHDLGADSYFIKPVDPNEFMTTVRTLGESLADSGRLPPGEYGDLDRVK